MGFSLAIERRDQEWHAHVREVPGTGSIGPSREAAVAGAMRKLAEKAERGDLPSSVQVLMTEPPQKARALTATDFLALWERLPRPDPEWADAAEEATRNQALSAGDSAWDS